MLHINDNLTHQERIHEDRDACELRKEIHHLRLYSAISLLFHDQNLIDQNQTLFLVNNPIEIEILNKINF